MNIWPGLAAHWLSCHSYPVRLEGNLWSCVEMSKQIKDYPLHFIHPGDLFFWEPSCARWKDLLLRNKCIWALEMGLHFWGFSKASVPGYEHQVFRLQTISTWHHLKIRHLWDILSWAFKIPFIVGLVGAPAVFLEALSEDEPLFTKDTFTT